MIEKILAPVWNVLLYIGQYLMTQLYGPFFIKIFSRFKKNIICIVKLISKDMTYTKDSEDTRK